MRDYCQIYANVHVYIELLQKSAVYFQGNLGDLKLVIPHWPLFSCYFIFVLGFFPAENFLGNF